MITQTNNTIPCKKRLRQHRQVPCHDCVQRAAVQSEPRPISLCEECISSLPRPKHQALLFAQHKSLAILQPYHGRPSQGKPRQPQPGTADLTLDYRQLLSHQLETATRKWVDATNSRDFDNPVVSSSVPNLDAREFDAFEPTTSVAGVIKTFRAIVAEYPSYRLEVQDMQTIFQDDGLAAHVYINMIVTGRPVGLAVHSTAVFGWARLREGWKVVSFAAMRSMGPV